MGFNRFPSAEAHDRSHEQGYYALQNAITVALIAVEIGQQRIGWRYLVDTGGGLSTKLGRPPYPCLSIAANKLGFVLNYLRTIDIARKTMWL